MGVYGENIFLKSVKSLLFQIKTTLIFFSIQGEASNLYIFITVPVSSSS